jgi:hypothetical protein
MSGRPLSIDEPVNYTDPKKPDAEPEQLTKGEVIIRSVALGVPDYIACQAAGMHRATLARWKAAAAEAEGLEGDQLTGKQRKLRDFCNALARAEAESVRYAVAMVQAAMPSDWRAAIALIERRFPQDFGRRVEVKVDPVERKPAPIDGDLAKAASESFAVSALPAGLSPEDFLPEVGSGESAADE